MFTYFNDAAPQIVEGLVIPLYDTGKRPLGTLWVASHEAGHQFDATDARVMEQLAVQLVLAIKLRKKAKVLALLEQALKDKDMLVHEVQHRVKNTIQMTSALLHLQERAVSSIEARDALHEAQTRLTVLAKVYSSLLLPSSEDDAGKIDVAALIDSLVSALRDNGPPAGRIRVRTDCDALMLDPDVAVPIGLLVNEAVTNAFKHAFPDRRSGEIVVEVRCSAGKCRLEIRDDGAGFRHPLREGSLGMKLMQSLARQLKAQLIVEGEGGTSIRLTWRTSGSVRLKERQVETACRPNVTMA
jgi:two-component sensor histidine kinase